MREQILSPSEEVAGGIATMNRAGEHGAKAAVIEEKKLGGTCVNLGCVPKKIMWYGAQIAESIHKYGPDYGFTILGTNLIMQLFVRIVKPILIVLARLTMEASSVNGVI